MINGKPEGDKPNQIKVNHGGIEHTHHPERNADKDYGTSEEEIREGRRKSATENMKRGSWGEPALKEGTRDTCPILPASSPRRRQYPHSNNLLY